MKLIENFLPIRLQDEISTVMSDSNFAWFYENETVSTEPYRDNFIITDHTKDSPQFNHVFYYKNQVTSNFCFNVMPILYLLEQKEVITINHLSRIKANLMLKDSSFPTGFFNTAHIDVERLDENYMTLLYYVDDSDGDTVMYNEFVDSPTKKITIAETFTPKKGSALLFDSKRWHASSPPRINDIRRVINFVFQV